MRLARVPMTAALALGLPLTVAAPALACPPVPGAPPDVLRVTVDDGGGRLSEFDLRCDPVGGTHPEAPEACARLERLGGPVGPSPHGTMCTMIYSGPQRATVRGSWRGRPVDARYDRSNGCETARWRRMAPVLPAPAVRDGSGDLGV
ncbi:SSI family serine proteinase inhibitor [Actinacidiphila glaucinigra]|uniref:SSI family serine proteinase inhibitor n=1 Tax=Actinacidiphila glaucinigra TaxID=235986 RepID=UPI003D9272D4